MLNDRGNGATDKLKAVIFSTDSTGQMKWYHEVWDSLKPKDQFEATKVLEDSQGNFYVFGAFLPLGEFPNFKGLVIKFLPQVNYFGIRFTHLPIMELVSEMLLLWRMISFYW